MARIFRNKQFSSYLGENRAILDIVTQYTTGTTPTPPVVYPFNIGRGYDQRMDAVIQVGDYYYVGGQANFYQLDSINHMNKISKNTAANDPNFSCFFGTGFTQDGTIPQIYSIAVQTDGKLIIGGAWDFGTYFPAGNENIARINADGSLDATFSGTALDSVRDILYGTNNKIYTCRTNGCDAYELDGSNYSSFTCTLVGNALRIIELSDGNLLIGGSFTTVNGTSITRIAKISKTGVLDSTFRTNVGSGFNGTVHDMVQGSDGGIYVSGSFDRFNGVSANKIVKLNSNGTRDTSFNIGTGFGTGPLIVIYKILFDTNRVICLGSEYVSTYNGTTFYGAMIALNLNGTIDTTFGDVTTIGYGFTDIEPGQQRPKEALIDSDGNLLVVGQFTLFSGKNYSRIIKINPNGEAITSIV